MEETYVKVYKNLDYDSGGDLVKCKHCGSLMYVPFAMGVCPECGESHHLENIEIDADIANVRYEYAVIEDNADYCESGVIDDDGYPIAAPIKSEKQ